MLSKESKNTYILSVIGLLIVALLWGLGFPALKFCENVPTFLTMAIRFTMASLFLGIIFFKKLRHVSKEAIKVGIWVGVLMFLCYLSATIGIKYTTAARCSFFSCLGAIAVPILNWVFYKEKIAKKFFVCMIICFVGVYLFSMGGTADFGLSMGDMICLLATVFGAAQLIELEHKALGFDIICLTVVELFTMAVLSIAGIFVAGEPIPSHFNQMEIGSLIFMGIFSSAVAFVLQLTCVKHVPSNRTSIILTLEPVLGAISSVLIFNDVLGWAGIIGGALIVISIIISEYSSNDSVTVNQNDEIEINEAN